MIIRVKKIHIERGIVRDCESCPVALAMIEQLPDIVYAQIAGAEATVYDEELNVVGEYALPAAVAEFARAFDDGQKVEPFSFELPEKKRCGTLSNIYHFCRKCEKAAGVTAEMRCSGCGELVCLVCGCTESAACVSGASGAPCGWARSGICTDCISKVDAQGNPNGAQIETMVIENQANSRTNH